MNGWIPGVLDEGEDFSCCTFTIPAPPSGLFHSHGAFFEPGEGAAVYAGVAQIGQFLSQCMVEEEGEGIFPRQFKEVNGHMRSYDGKVFRQGLHAYVFEHAPDLLVEVFYGEDALWAYLLKIMHDSGDKVFPEGRDIPSYIYGGQIQGPRQPLLIIGGDAVFAYPQKGAPGYISYHEGRLLFLLAEYLDFADEFVYVLELAVDGDIADVGDWVEVMEFLHDELPNVRGGDFTRVFLMEV